MAVQSLAIFDIDGTLLKGQSQEALLKFLYENKYVSGWYYFKIMLWFALYKLHVINNPKKVMEYAFSAFEGMPVVQAENIINLFFENKLKKLFFREGLALVSKLKSDGYRVILVSNAIDLIVKKISEYTNADHFISTILEKKDGYLSGKIEGPIMYGKTKKDYIDEYLSKNHMSWAEIYSFGDHISDVPMLELSGHPHAVNPSRELSLLAAKRKWPILNFKKAT